MAFCGSRPDISEVKKNVFLAQAVMKLGTLHCGVPWATVKIPVEFRYELFGMESSSGVNCAALSMLSSTAHRHSAVGAINSYDPHLSPELSLFF